MLFDSHAGDEEGAGDGEDTKPEDGHQDWGEEGYDSKCGFVKIFPVYLRTCCVADSFFDGSRLSL